jgi:hypothetical protein
MSSEKSEKEVILRKKPRYSHLLGFALHIRERLWEPANTGLVVNLPMRNYHGFKKCALPEALVAPILRENGFAPREVQVEVVRVTGDLAHMKHHHEQSAAVCLVLGPRTQCPPPTRAEYYLHHSWSDVENEEQIISIAAGETHGFTVERDGDLWFLSVQSPPIETENGDDFILDEE